LQTTANSGWTSVWAPSQEGAFLVAGGKLRSTFRKRKKTEIPLQK
jgi:hypothetical protein